MGEWEEMYGNSEADNDAFYEMLDSSHEMTRHSCVSEVKEIQRDKIEFVPRWGANLFDCKYCGAVNMQWKEVYPDSWKPFDVNNNRVHECSTHHSENLTQKKVLEYLQDFGFEGYIPRTSSWKFVFTASNKTKSLYFLVGKRGIDLKFYDSGRDLLQDEEGKLYTDGGLLVRNYYKDSDVNIHKLVLDLASQFVTDSPINDTYFVGHGKSWSVQKAEYAAKFIN